MHGTRTGPSALGTWGWSDVLKPLGTTYNRYALTLEDWETGSLPGAYVGDRGSFDVQSNTVDSGSFACEINAGFGSALISRVDAPISPGTKLTLTERRADNSNSQSQVGVAFGGESATGFGSWSGYVVLVNINGNVQITRVDNGSGSTLKTGSQSAPTGSFQDLVVEWEDNGTMTGRVRDSGGSQIGSDTQATDATYSGNAWGIYGAFADGVAGDLAVEPLPDASLGFATL